MDKHAPIVSKTVTVRHKTPWFNDEISKAKQNRRACERKWSCTKLQVHLDILKQSRLTVNMLCAKAKKQFYVDKVTKSAGDQKVLFSVANELLHKTNDSSLPSHKDSVSLANDFALFFVDKIHKISEKFKDPQLSRCNRSQNIPTFTDLQEVSEDTVKKIILKGNAKSCHLDPLPTSLLKDTVDLFVPFLTHFINSSISSSTVPSSCKAASVTPLLKKVSLDKNEFQNYRPVSNLPYVAKILEKVVVQQLTNHLEVNNLAESCQSAYHKAHSTETALVKITNDVLCSMDENKCVLLVLLDLSAAFDTVHHEVLFNRLYQDYGVEGSTMNWMRSYFSGRTQAVNINGVMSDPVQLSTGLPQGSVLGPFQFPIYSTPLFKIARQHNIQIHMYADDTQLYLPFVHAEYQSAVVQMQNCLCEIRRWMENNHLKLNDSKTEYMVIGSKFLVNKIDSPLTIQIGEETVTASASVRNIGAHLNTNMDMSAHIKSVCRSCYCHLRNISRMRPFLSDEAAATIVHAFISSKLDFMNSLLYKVPECHLRRLQLIQNTAARIVTRTKRIQHIMPVLQQLHWLPP